MTHRRKRSFNPRAPCGARLAVHDGANKSALFQSTRPVWGATRVREGSAQHAGVSIHAPRVGRDLNYIGVSPVLESFNPRAPCGARRTAINNDCIEETFQSTRPVWGATNGMHLKTMNIFVSIHAPRVGRDKGSFVPRTKGVCFNPRAPCGARLSLLLLLLHCLGFQSTRPVWGATATGVTTSPFCHVFMGIPLHKYDFLGT